ncbi:protein MON2 homolog isoform X2 [Dreissena polymorpha]|uniref:protein MON2 homolog isoform X2 n=1 Tax=Dreissena polymorpha TaxID=45954 RepID=UPI002264CB4D|nr:protein MON2 homolog isoform X2 [Dreissena polymorpha]
MATAGNMKDPTVAKKLFENLQSDLRLLSTEGKRKHPNVKEASEKVQLKLRTISAKGDDMLSGLVSASSEILQPFVQGCDTKNVKLVQIGLTAVQRMISHEAISITAADDVLNMLWGLMESGLEELKLLQTAILLITTNFVVQHESLSKALVICLRLHFTKDSTTNNTAAAAIKQLVSIVFERVIAEDNLKLPDFSVDVSETELKTGSSKAPLSLRPCAGDAYLLFQDLCQLVNADQPFWLQGMTEMTRTFGLELLESVLTAFPSIFSQHKEFSFLLKERVCPLVIKLFSPSLKYRQGAPTPPSPTGFDNRPFFPIVMRLLRIVSTLIQFYYNLMTTECEIFLSLLVKFLEPEKPTWQRCLALEVLHKLFIQPELVKSFCLSYDMKPHSTKIFRDMVNGIGAFIQSQFMNAPGGQASQGPQKQTDLQGSPPALVGGMPIGSGMSPPPAFMYRGVWIPLVIIIPQGQTRPTFLEMLDKVEPPTVPDGYGLSVGFYCLVEAVRTIQLVVEGGTPLTGKREKLQGTKSEIVEPKENDQILKDEERSLYEELVNSSWCGMLAALALLLDASTDESATESVLKCQEAYISLCGRLEMSLPRDAFITSICKASLPPHYALTILNTQGNMPQKGLIRAPSQDLQSASSEATDRSQVVAVGTALPTAALPVGAHQGPVMLTAKNIQCMRSLLCVAHCHGGILGSAWHLVLTTLQHLVWILGLKPSSGGSLKASQPDSSGAIITTAVLTELPVLSSMLSRLFESSQYLNDVALHHLIDALCKLSTESMELAYSNREPSLFAVAKLLETGLVNLSRVDILWRPVTAHLLEVSQHPHLGLRNWGAEAITNLVKAALAYKHTPPLQENLRLQASILAPLQDLSTITQPDIRQKQLQCVFQILHDNGDTLHHGWPLILGVIGAVTNDHGEKLVQTAFQSLQLVVTDFLPIIPCCYLEVVVTVASKFGLQKQELNVSLTAIGLLWNISDYFYQNRERIKTELNKSKQEGDTKVTYRSDTKVTDRSGDTKVTDRSEVMTAFDGLWMCLFMRLGDLCVDSRPAVRKSAGQTLFSTISTHGGLLEQASWKKVLWKVLFPLLDNVKKLSSTAPNTKDQSAEGNILIHHSRDTAEKQWAETRVLTLAGVARTFTAQRRILQGFYQEFPHAWALLLEHIEVAALCQNAEISIAAIKSFQEMLLMQKDETAFTLPTLPVKPPVNESINRTGESPEANGKSDNQNEAEETTGNEDYDIALWSAAWKVWLNIGTNATKPPEDSNSLYIPSQAFLTALIQTFPPLLEHIKTRFSVSDLQKLSGVLKRSLTVPVHGDSSPFILPAYPDVSTTPLQEATLQAVEAIIKTVKAGSDTMHNMYPDIFDQLMTYVDYGIRVPKFGKIETKHIGSVRGPTVDWVTMNFVPFAERCVKLIVDMYLATASHPTVIQAHVLQNIIKTFRQPLGLKYGCPSQSTWMLVINSLLSILNKGLPVARKHESEFSSMWSELALTLDEFLFSKNPSPPTMSIEEFQRDESLDCKVVCLMRDDILPYSSTIPLEFTEKVMAILNRGSIHATSSDSFIDTDSSRKLREEFAKTCFETLLQFSYINRSKTGSDSSLTRLAVIALLQRCQEVVKKYSEDEKLSGKCPLPRPRLAEMASVLKAVTTLIASLKKAPQANVEPLVWQHVIQLYPNLVDCTTSHSPSVCKALRDALWEYKDLLTPPTTSPLHNGR